MSSDDKFKFISIDDDDDEIVIQAGVRQNSSSQTNEANASLQSDDCSVKEDQVLFDDGDKCADNVTFTDDDECVESDPQEEAERARHERERARRAAQAQANRMITTEEDLKAKTPFSSMRRGIIIAAILILIVACLYFNFH